MAILSIASLGASAEGLYVVGSLGYYNEGGLKLDGNDIKLGFYYNF